MYRCLALVLVLFSLPASAQERTFPVTLTETQWNKLGGILAKVKEPWEDTNPIIQAITGQVGQTLRTEAQGQKALVDELEALKKKQAESAAEIAGLKSELEQTKKPPAAPEPEKP